MTQKSRMRKNYKRKIHNQNVGGIGNCRRLSFGPAFLSKRKDGEEARPPKPFLQDIATSSLVPRRSLVKALGKKVEKLAE